MIYALTVGMFANLVMVVAGVFVCWHILRYLDKTNGFNFSEALDELRNGNIAVAVYFGIRFFAVLFFIGAIMARVPY